MARPRKQTYTMSQYLENVKDGYISNDADTQRSPAWKPIVDGLVVTILNDDYVPVIILAEEDSGQIHIVDGGSRTAAFKMIRYGNHKIKPSVEDPIIQYKRMTKDENGKAIWEDAEFDIRNKTFDQFPKELQKKFDEYQVDTVVHENCNKERIAMYIKRYNEHKAMNANQKMFVYLPAFAEQIRDISNRRFFINHCDINDNDKEKGMLERIIAESVMCMFHFNKWNKNGKVLATYQYNTTVKRVTIDAESTPLVGELVMTADKHNNKKGKVGEVQIDIPSFQLSGTFDISLEASGTTTTKLDGDALAVEGASCADGSVYAYITEIPSVASSVAVNDLAVTPAVISIAVNEEKKLNIIGIKGGLYSNVSIDAKDCVISSDEPSKATVTDGVVKGVQAGTTYINVSYGEVKDVVKVTVA